MKKLIIFVLIILTGCLFLPAPEDTWYKPVDNISFKITNPPMYEILLIDSVQFYSSLRFESIPREKELFLNVKVINNALKPIIFYADSLEIISERLVFNLNYEPDYNCVISIEPNDSLFLKYNSQLLLFNNRQWYSKIKKYDTLTLKVLIDESYYSIPFYFNKKDGLETYPFERDW